MLLPIYGEVAAKLPEGLTQSGFPSPHRGEGQGEGRESMLLPIHGEVAAEPPEGLERISI